MLTIVARRITDWWNRQSTVEKLQALDDRLLEDMGTSRKDLLSFVIHSEQSC